MKRIKLKKRNKVNPFLALIFSLIISLILSLHFIGKRVTPYVEKYAIKQAKRLSTVVIEKSVTKEMLNDFSSNKIFVENKNNDGSVETIDFNTKKINEMLITVSSSVKKRLKDLEQGKIDNLEISDNELFNIDSKKLKNGVIYEIPSGIIFNNSLLNNIGPKIPVKLSMLGDVVTDIDLSVNEYGINSVMIKVGVKVILNEQVILPFNSNQVKIETVIPIAMKLVQGNIPSYIFNNDKVKS